ncbi:MAG: DegT/DnrJ/EryC1/StrS family aminotransferase [bacterium]
MKVPLIDLRAQYVRLKDEIDAAVASVLDSGMFILGEHLQAFEREFASYVGVRHAIGVSSGTAALRLALEAARVGPGDEVIVQANTFIATAFAVSLVGATPVIADIVEDTYEIDVDNLVRKITPRTRALIPVHLFGMPCDIGRIQDIADKKGLAIIEDCAQAHGARYNGKQVGGFGAAAAFSFYPVKNLGALGDGGAVTTGDDDIAGRIRLLRNYGKSSKYDHVCLAGNERLDDLQAAILFAKLRHLDEDNAARRRLARLYSELLASTPVKTPHIPDGREPVFHLYVIRCAERDALLEHLRSQGIGVQIHYPTPVHLVEAYAGRLGGEGTCPVAERAAKEILSLPLYPEMSEEQVRYVVSQVAAFYGM